MSQVIPLGSSHVVSPQRNPVRGEAYSAARGAGLIGLAVFLGFILFQVVDSPGTSSGGGGGGGVADESTVVTQETLPDDAGTARPPGEFLTIVLNASGEGGVAQNLTNTLRPNGYNLLTPGNAPLQEGTTVQCQEGFDAEAQALLFAVGMDATVAPYEPPPADAGEGAADAQCVVYLGQTPGATTET